MAEQVEFELSVLSWRIWNESEPPNFATEKNTSCGVIPALNPQSPVRVREGHTPKPREDTGFWGATRVPASSSPMTRTSWRSKSNSNSHYVPANLGRIRTAQLGNRENPGLLRLRCREPALSGSDTRRRDAQHPAESRSFLGLFPGVRPKSLRLETEWRWRQSGANSSLLSLP